MTYLNLIPALLVIVAYFLGRYIGRGGRDAEVIRLVADNARLKVMLDFTQAENEHVGGLLNSKIGNAHAKWATSMIEIHADEQMRETARLRALMPDPHE